MLLGEIVSEVTNYVVPTRLIQAFGDIFGLMILSHIGTGVDLDRLLGSKIIFFKTIYLLRHMCSYFKKLFSLIILVPSISTSVKNRLSYGSLNFHFYFSSNLEVMDFNFW